MKSYQFTKESTELTNELEKRFYVYCKTAKPQRHITALRSDFVKENGLELVSNKNRKGVVIVPEYAIRFGSTVGYDSMCYVSVASVRKFLGMRG